MHLRVCEARGEPVCVGSHRWAPTGVTVPVLVIAVSIVLSRASAVGLFHLDGGP